MIGWLTLHLQYERKEHDIHTKQVKKKQLKNKNICTIYIYFFLFRQLSLSPPISYFSNAIVKNQTIFFFFFLLFRQCHCHKPIATNFFPPPISAMPSPQIHSTKFFPLYFGNAITTNQLPLFFFFLEKWYVHTIFTTNSKWKVVTSCYCWIKKVISVLNSNLN